MLSKCVYRLGLCPLSPECVLGMHRACLWCLPRITRVRYWGLPDIMGLPRGCPGKSPGKVLLGFARCHGDATRLPAGRGSCVIRIAHRARHPHFPQQSTAALRVIVLGSMHRFCLGGTCTSRRVQLRRRSALRPVCIGLGSLIQTKAERNQQPRFGCHLGSSRVNSLGPPSPKQVLCVGLGNIFHVSYSNCAGRPVR